MVAPVNTTGPITSFLRTFQPSNVNQAANRQVAQTVLNQTPVAAKKSSDVTTTLASAKSPPPSNLPRGSIVDKLV